MTVSRPRTSRVAFALALGLILTLLPAGTQWRAVATPRTQSALIEGLPAQADARARTDALAPAVEDPAGPGAGVTTRAVRAPIAFSLLGFEVPAGTGSVAYRTSVDGQRWTDWADVEGLHRREGPDAGSPEAGPDGRVDSAPAWVGRARFVQVAVTGADPGAVDVSVIDSAGLNGGGEQVRFVPADGTRASHRNGVDVVTRAEWGAASYKGEPDRADRADMIVVHHTVTGNGYSRAEAPDVVRGIQRYHQESNGWDDIGYNLLVDRFGNVYEGRAGGLDRPVIGAHARGWNTGSVGIAVLGTHTSHNPSNETLWALINIAGWKAGVHGIDPEGTTTRVGDGSRTRTVVGHRDVGSTSCPGWELHNELPWMRPEIAERAYPFSDVDAGGTHAGAILRLYHDGVVQGCAANRFCPVPAITRAQAASLIVRALDDVEPVEGSRFPDVPESSVHAAAINGLVEHGAIDGYPDGTFRPHQPVERDQMATIVARALDLEESEGTRFEDVSRDSPHYEWIYRLADEGIVKGKAADRYAPGLAIRRDESATVIDRVRTWIDENRVEASPSPTTTGTVSPSPTSSVSPSPSPSSTGTASVSPSPSPSPSPTAT